MHLNVLTQCTPSPQYKGLWRHPADRTASGYRSAAYWVDVARKLEQACIDALFFADIHGVYDVYGGSADAALRNAVQVPSVDPTLVVPIAAAATRQLGFAVTYSTTYHAPFQCARVFSSLDHLSDGRIAWNVVTSYLSSASDNGLGEMLAHDQRYDRADEYVEVARALWESSWDDTAVVRDAASGVFVDAARVRELGHRGQYFSVRGPHQCEPSPQRTPVLYQAGISSRGTSFAARHAEVAFLTLTDPTSGAIQVRELRDKVEQCKRPRSSLKILKGEFILIGASDKEAREKADAVVALTSHEGYLARWCGWMGFDLGAYPDDARVAEIQTEASRSVLTTLRRLDPERDWCIADVRSFALMMSRPRRRTWLYGSPQRIADRMEEWIERTGVDGFNLIPCPTTQGIDDICDLLIPELQRRGTFRREYEPDRPTLRERYFGAGVRRYGEW